MCSADVVCVPTHLHTIILHRLEQEDPERAHRFHEDEFHNWGDEDWDLPVHALPPGGVTLLDDDEIRELVPTTIGVNHVAGAHKWSDLDEGVRGHRSKLLSEVTGITACNHGINCVMLDLLTPYRTLMCRLQTQSHPIAHRVCRWFHDFFNHTNINFLGDDPLYGPHFNEWLSNTTNDRLKDQIKKMVSRFARKLLQSVKYRLQPYWGLIMA